MIKQFIQQVLICGFLLSNLTMADVLPERKKIVIDNNDNIKIAIVNTLTDKFTHVHIDGMTVFGNSNEKYEIEPSLPTVINEEILKILKENKNYDLYILDTNEDLIKESKHFLVSGWSTQKLNPRLKELLINSVEDNTRAVILIYSNVIDDNIGNSRFKFDDYGLYTRTNFNKTIVSTYGLISIVVLNINPYYWAGGDAISSISMDDIHIEDKKQINDYLIQNASHRIQEQVTNTVKSALTRSGLLPE